MRIEVRTPAEVSEVSRALQRANQRRLADRQADGWAERDAVRLVQRARSKADSLASRAAKADPWKGAIPEFDPPPEVRAHRGGRGILVTAAGEYADGKIKAKAAPFQNVYFSSWGKIYSGYTSNGDLVSVPMPWILANRQMKAFPDYNSASIEESMAVITWPPPIPQPPRWRFEAPGGYVNFDIGQPLGEGTPMVLYSGGAGQSAGVGWTFASNFDHEHPQFARFDLTNAYRDVTIGPDGSSKTVYPAIDINGTSVPGTMSLPPLQNPAAAAKNFNQFTFEAICAAGGASLDIDFNNMQLGVGSISYNLRISSVRKQSDPDNPSTLVDSPGILDSARGPLHHYAITVNNGEAFFHVDGRLVDSYFVESDFWTYERGYAGAVFAAGDLPIMMKALVRYDFIEQEVTTWFTGTYYFTADGSGGTGYVPYVSYPLTQTIPGSPPAAIQSLRFTPKPLYANQDFQSPAMITALHP
jgi:hypothetical protein